jgi:hypothetical protein
MRPRLAGLAVGIAVAAGALGAATITPASGTPGTSSQTLDVDHDGHLDHVRVLLAASPQGRVTVAVAGYTVRSTVRRGRVLLATLAEHTAPDTGARPRVTVRSAAGTVAVQARDDAPPVLLAATQAASGGPVTLRWSEPISAPPARVRDELSLRSVSGAVRPPLAVRTAAADTELQLQTRVLAADLSYHGRAVVDRAGNAAAAVSMVVHPAATSAAPPAAGDAGRPAAARPKPSGTGTANDSKDKNDPTPPPSAGAGASTPGGDPTTTDGGDPPADSGTNAPGGSTDDPTTPGGWNVLGDPIDPAELTDVAFCQRSYWLQPWRAYLDTPPASNLSDALGINFNVGTNASSVVAGVLGASGFRRARLEEGWGNMSYADPAQLANPSDFVTELQQLRANGIRPLILLNANDGDPGPELPVNLTITQAAPRGAQTVQLNAASAAAVVPGLTGVNGSVANQEIITAVDANAVATLSQPLPAAVPAGTYPGETWRYQPFAPPQNGDGTANANFQHTLSGWLAYVAAVTNTAKAALGGDNFDVEVWNELNFGSSFLSAANYYSPVPTALGGTGDVDEAVLTSTLAWLRDPANGMLGVGVSDGFASQNPFDTGSGLTGLTALSKHPYPAGRTTFSPGIAGVRACEPLDADGQRDGVDLYTNNLWYDSFTPTFTSYFPEYYLSAIQTESLVRDLSPITNAVYGASHGRAVEPQIWVTETNIDAGQVSLSTADQEHMQAKATLRTLVSFVNKGVSQLDFYSALGSEWGLIDPVDMLASNYTDGGPTLDALSRMFDFIGPTHIAVPRALTLQSIAQWGEDAQFAGDGTAAHPPLYNRDVLGVFPFQVSDDSFVVPAYVMTRDVAHLYDTSASSTDVTRYDLPPETYRLTLGGVDGNAVTVQAFDPLSNVSVPAVVVARSATTVTVQLALTDSPRLLRLTD